MTSNNPLLKMVETTWEGGITAIKLADVNADLTRFYLEEGARGYLNDFSGVEHFLASITNIFKLPIKSMILLV
jgi:hypothetical protein